MRWRCADCGRVRESGGGTCACGGEEFERLVVQLTKRCTTCGEAVPENTSTCPECGFTGFETLAGEGQAAEEHSYLEWRCAECGRAHPKHTPPCSRCGHETLERHRVDGGDVAVDDVVDEYFADESLLPSFERTTLVGVALVLAVLVAIWTFVPGAALPGTRGPWVASINQSALETELVDGVNAERVARDRASLARSASLDETAATLAADAAAGEAPTAEATSGCEGAAAVYRGLDGSGEWPGDGQPRASAVADAVLEDVFATEGDAATLTATDVGEIGAGSTVDGDDQLHVVVVVC